MSGEQSDTAKDILNRQGRMKSARSNFDAYWHEIAQRVLPRGDNFNVTRRTPGQKLDQEVFDSTAPLALVSFGAAMESLVVPRTQKWHTLAPTDYRLRDNRRVRIYCEQVRDLLFRVRYSPSANFASQAQEKFLSLGAFGTGGMFVEDGLSRGISYQHIPLPELFIAENAQGVVDTIYRRYTRTVRQAYQMFGDALPESILKLCEKEPDRDFEFIHAVQPNSERKSERFNHEGMAFASYHVCVEKNTLLSTGGYRTKPYMVSRYVTSMREMYGRSPAMDALADIKTVNEMTKTQLRVGQLMADPLWLTYDVDSLNPFSVRPSSINAGYLNERGEPLAKPVGPSGDPKFSLEMANQRRETINRAFLVTLFQILVDTPQMTATEVMQRAQEKGALLAPTMGRIQSEFLGPLIEREIDILQHAGALPPPPPELVEAGGDLDIVYDSPLSRAQRADEGVGILRTIEAVTPLANVDPSVLKRFNTDRVIERLAEINGAPVDILYSEEEMAARNQQIAQQQQLQQMLQAAPVAAETAKTIAQANKEASAAPF